LSPELDPNSDRVLRLWRLKEWLAEQAYWEQRYREYAKEFPSSEPLRILKDRVRGAKAVCLFLREFEEAREKAEEEMARKSWQTLIEAMKARG